MRLRKDAEGKPFTKAFTIEGGHSDILVAEGDHLYFGQFKYTLDLTSVNSPYIDHANERKVTALDISKEDYVDKKAFAQGFANTVKDDVTRGHMGDRQVGLHLITTGGFLDDTWFNRIFWMYSKTWPGFHWARLAPKSGQILVIGDTRTYAVQAYPARVRDSPQFNVAKRGYLLIADRNDNEPIMDSRAWEKDKGIGFLRSAHPQWHQWIPIRMRSMVLAGNKLVVAGSPDILDPQDPMAAFEGRKGSLLRVLDSANGKMLTQCKLDNEPVFDGMIAANGKLFISQKNGNVACFSSK